ncbi:exonuclease SbcCD subunit D C-terminal domain-containing protein [Desulfogranum mediterraneum]|uniref:exonuclease SbcCD subunit D C-terminal domain-containing protein n=1 Tax=Desulfogranum mediterraneum TaxID=160661 RepID=UPI0003F56AD5|nr:exonuclease SbcCD subunit D C-terminal domain-containing protein [Desulfogranum mediterraneum]
MRFIHTSDWHIGQRLYGQKRYQEFERFLDWLADYIEAEAIEALLVSGDIFDTATPGNRAQALYYGFLHRLASTSCGQVVIIAGNHDSPTLLEAPSQLLRQFNIQVIGSPEKEPADQVFLLRDQNDDPAMIVCAIPFLRDRDIRTAQAGEDLETKAANLRHEIQAHYQRVCAAALDLRRQNEAPLPIVAMGHLFTSGGTTVEGDGVRELYIGGLGRLDAGSFPAAIDYLALGHLHSSQRVGGQEHLRYSGAPLAMGFNEAGQEKVILEVDCTPDKLAITPVAVPCFQELRVLHGELSQLLDRIAQLRLEKSSAWLELRHQGQLESGLLREQLLEAVEGSELRILAIRTASPNLGSLCQQQSDESLDELSVEEVFERCLGGTDFPADRCEELRLAFQEIVTSMNQEDRNAE